MTIHRLEQAGKFPRRRRLGEDSVVESAPYPIGHIDGETPTLGCDDG